MRSAFNDGSSYCVTAVNINPKRTREWRALYESDPKSQLLLTAFSLLEARKVCEGTSLPHIYRTRESRPPPSKTKTGLTSSVEASFIGTPFVFGCIVLSLVRAGILIIYDPFCIRLHRAVSGSCRHSYYLRVTNRILLLHRSCVLSTISLFSFPDCFQTVSNGLFPDCSSLFPFLSFYPPPPLSIPLKICKMFGLGWHRRCKILCILVLALVGNDAVKHASHCVSQTARVLFFFFAVTMMVAK